MPVKKVVILGTGGTSMDILDSLHDLNRLHGDEEYECVRLLDDNPSLWGQRLQGIEIGGPVTSARCFADCSFVNGIGSPDSFRRKEAILASTDLPLDRFLTIVHPTAAVSRTARIGKGSVVLQNVTINTNVRIGDHVVVLPNSVLSHDSAIGDYTCIAGGVCLSGGVVVGRSCYLGTNSAVIGNVRVGDGSLVGMGSVVLSDVQTDTVVAGNPARYLRRVSETP